MCFKHLFILKYDSKRSFTLGFLITPSIHEESLILSSRSVDQVVFLHFITTLIKISTTGWNTHQTNQGFI